jgi:hypothetical protein
VLYQFTTRLGKIWIRLKLEAKGRNLQYWTAESETFRKTGTVWMKIFCLWMNGKKDFGQDKILSCIPKAHPLISWILTESRFKYMWPSLFMGSASMNSTEYRLKKYCLKISSVYVEHVQSLFFLFSKQCSITNIDKAFACF